MRPTYGLNRLAKRGAFAALETQSQFVVLVNLSSSQITPIDADALETVPVNTLPLQVSQVLVNQAMDIVRISAGSAPVWQMERLESTDAANATVTGAALTTVLDYDGSWRMQAVYTVRNRGRQFLALKLPEDSRLLSVFVRGQPSRTVETTLGTEPVHLVALPQTSAADLSFDIRLILTGRMPTALPRNLSLLPRKLVLPAPSVVTPEEAVAAGQPDLGMPVVETQWTVHLPKEIDGTANQTNLSDTGDSALFHVQQLAADVAAVKRALLDPRATRSQRTLAANNLKQIELELHNYDDSGIVRGGAQSLEWSVRTEEVQREIEEAITLSETADTTLHIVDEAQALGEQELGRNYIISNNADIATRNDFSVSGVETGPVSGLNFNTLSEDEALSGLIAEDNRAKAAGDRGELRAQIQGQALVLQDQESGEIGGGLMMGGRLPSGGGGGFGGGGMGDLDNLIATGGRITLDQSGQQAGGEVTFEDMFVLQPEGEDGLNQLYSGFEVPAQAGGLSGSLDGNRTLLGAPIADLPAWTSAGGLSLDMSIPVTENTLTFSKVGGQPELMLSVRPRRTITLGIGALWTLLWVVIGIWAARTLARAGAADQSARALPKILIAIGLLGFFLLPDPVRWGAFALFVIAAVAYGFRQRPTQAA